MFSYYSLILNKCKTANSKIIYPNNIGVISFLQLVNLKKNNFINNHNEKVYNYTNRRQDYILLNKGELELELFNKQMNKNCKLLLNNNSLILNNELIINEPILLNIVPSIYYNVKATKKSNFLFYSCDYNINNNNVQFDYYKLDNLYNNYNKYINEEYSYFDCKINEFIP